MGDFKYKREHREQGLCMNCSRPSVPGRVKCATHLQNHADLVRRLRQENPEKERETQRKLKEKRSESGRCPTCGGPRDSSNVTCSNCSCEIRPQMGIPVFKHKRGFIPCELSIK